MHVLRRLYGNRLQTCLPQLRRHLGATPLAHRRRTRQFSRQHSAYLQTRFIDVGQFTSLAADSHRPPLRWNERLGRVHRHAGKYGLRCSAFLPLVLRLVPCLPRGLGGSPGVGSQRAETDKLANPNRSKFLTTQSSFAHTRSSCQIRNANAPVSI